MPPQKGKEVLVGPGGWAYLPVAGDKLGICSKLFDFVEVNNTFYTLPGQKQAKRWKEDVDRSGGRGNFRFTLRANREMTHVEHLKPSSKVFGLYDKMAEICKILDADVLHFQLPPSYEIGRQEVESLRDFFSAVTKPTSNTAFALEVRSANPAPELYRFMEDNNIVHSVDLSKGDPAYENKAVTYSRVFGKGYKSVYEFDDKEIRELAKKAESQKSKRTYIAFHNLKMYEDASRLRDIIRKTERKAPPLTEKTEQRTIVGPGKSLVRLLQDLKFPVTKKGLIRQVGWRTIPRDSERIHVSEAVKDIPDKKYVSASEILSAADLKK